MHDLSPIHRPLGADRPDATSRPPSGARLRLGAEELAAYRDQGFVAGLPVLGPRAVARLRSELSALCSPDHPRSSLFHELHFNESGRPDQVLFHALGAWRIEEGFHDLLFNEAITGPAAQLLEARPRFWHDQLFCKPAGDGGIVAWHQDYSYWTRTEPMNHLTCFVALDDTDEENGCLHCVPGSHRWQLLPPGNLADDMDAIQQRLSPRQREQFRPVPLRLRAGEASFHHPLTVHGSYPNRSSRPRRAAVLNFFADGTRTATDQPLLDGVPALPRGSRIEGPFFPLLGPSVA